jgi:hypothetical protein
MAVGTVRDVGPVRAKSRKCRTPMFPEELITGMLPEEGRRTHPPESSRPFGVPSGECNTRTDVPAVHRHARSFPSAGSPREFSMIRSLNPLEAPKDGRGSRVGATLPSGAGDLHWQMRQRVGHVALRGDEYNCEGGRRSQNQGLAPEDVTPENVTGNQGRQTESATNYRRQRRESRRGEGSDSHAAFPRDHNHGRNTTQQGNKADKGFGYVSVRKLRDLREGTRGS